jgi:hypothetical protein
MNLPKCCTPDTGKRSVKACSSTATRCSSKHGKLGNPPFLLGTFNGRNIEKNRGFSELPCEKSMKGILEDVLDACSKNVTGEDFKIELAAA